jgi:hypothetical protein
MSPVVVAIVAVVAVVAAVTVVPMVAVAAPVARVVLVHGAGAEGKATKNQQGQGTAQEGGSHGKGFLGNGKKKLGMFLLKRHPKKHS